ncbi:MAG: hypothetical protein K0S78_6132 [Thermomicrobiales bacterium]|jgi:hypothetical protein|nr:hypothetical protein [Thermomicrobiales bacterium]
MTLGSELASGTVNTNASPALKVVNDRPKLFHFFVVCNVVRVSRKNAPTTMKSDTVRAIACPTGQTRNPSASIARIALVTSHAIRLVGSTIISTTLYRSLVRSSRRIRLRCITPSVYLWEEVVCLAVRADDPPRDGFEPPVF